MSTTVHLPPKVLESVDRRAQDLGTSRNRYILRALEKILELETQWSPRFLAELTAAGEDEEGQRGLEELRSSSTWRASRD